jgi:hypothetical protein
MKAVVNFTVDDLLNNYLFVASKSKAAVSKRLKVRLILVAGCLIGAVGSFIGQDYYMMWGFIIAAFFFLLVYPWVQGLIYKRNYRKHAEERYSGIKDVAFNYEITDDGFSTQSSIGDVIIKASQIELIVETQDYFFIRLSSQDTITLPKRCFDLIALSAQLTNIAAAHGNPIHKELDWKWK